MGSRYRWVIQLGEHFALEADVPLCALQADPVFRLAPVFAADEAGDQLVEPAAATTPRGVNFSQKPVFANQETGGGNRRCLHGIHCKRDRSKA